MLINRINIVGNLTKDPEIKKTESGKLVSNFSIAHNHSYLKNNQKVNKVSYFDVELWMNPLARESEHMKKGCAIAVEGRLVQDRWLKNGETKSRIKIVADIVRYLPKRNDGISRSQEPAPVSEIVVGVCKDMTDGTAYEE